jgi:hypothetical protein
MMAAMALTLFNNLRLGYRWGEHPIPRAVPPAYFPKMNQNKFSQDQNQKPESASRPFAVADSNQSGMDFAPSADELARKAYFSYVNDGSLPGHDVQHWLEAEAQLLEERNLTRIHGHRNHT